jgi:hypothetical protein
LPRTLNLLADTRYGLDAKMMVYLREYADAPPVAEYRAGWLNYRPMLRGIAAYSIAVATISKARMTDKQRSQKLADVLDELLRPHVERQDVHQIMTAAELNTMLARIIHDC